MAMIKFSGKVSCFKEFMEKLKETYGGKTTIKEICGMIGALRKC
jgi:hypothetical protein